jgi:hypothetical protein
MVANSDIGSTREQINKELQIQFDKLNSVKKTIRELYDQLYSLSPISRFPVELLCRIFTFVAPSDFEFQNDFQGRELHWIVVTHVCHHWRKGIFIVQYSYRIDV